MKERKRKKRERERGVTTNIRRHKKHTFTGHLTCTNKICVEMHSLYLNVLIFTSKMLGNELNGLCCPISFGREVQSIDTFTIFWQFLFVKIIGTFSKMVRKLLLLLLLGGYCAVGMMAGRHVISIIEFVVCFHCVMLFADKLLVWRWHCWLGLTGIRLQWSTLATWPVRMIMYTQRRHVHHPTKSSLLWSPYEQ